MYSAYFLTGKARKTIIDNMKPNFPDVLVHHVTIDFGVPPSTPIPPPAKVVAIGYISDESLEAIIVTVDGKQFRPDGKRYHITLSMDYSKGRRPVDSNDLIMSKKFTPIKHFEIDTVPKILK